MNDNKPVSNNPGPNNLGYFGYDPKDDRYTGAKAVVTEELADLKKRRQSDPDNLSGLALSGGGIRSSSFCLGVLQILAREKKLDKFDYLSTVSGGGYLGGALSWLWLDNWRKETKCSETKFGTGPDDFPFGTGDRHSNPEPVMDKKQASLMRHLRQHGKYLVPGHGITMLSFLSVVLRSITMGFVALIVLSSFTFHFLYYTQIFEQSIFMHTYALDIGIFALFAYFICLMMYGVTAIKNSGKDNAAIAYTKRRRWEIEIKYWLIAAISLITIALVAEMRINHDLLHSAINLTTAGGTTTVIGSLLTWFALKSENKNLLKIIPKSWLIQLGIIAMFIGLLMISNQIAVSLKENADTTNPINSVFLFHMFLAALIVYLSWKVPINKISIHRYYRDRLMETFMPDACDVFDGIAYQATKANTTTLYDCRPDKSLKKTNDQKDSNRMPYHIINCNLILVESEIAKFRGRGGDNFILSPLFCGSNATGWRESDKFANNSITLPTAIATSGAAANSDSGVAGKGLTMNPLVSALMNIFNLRLGYWTVNPDPRHQKDQGANPNYFKPGFRGIINRKKLNEKADFIQLSDGGHFENLAMYELLRRRCRLIICCDAEQDNDFVFDGLINIIEKARVDFGVKIEITDSDLDKLKYKKDKNGSITFADCGFLVMDIIYPDSSKGQLVYIKTTLTSDLPVDLTHYRDNHPDFPDESTIDQFFDEIQFEAYRRLGMHIAESLITDVTIKW